MHVFSPSIAWFLLLAVCSVADSGLSDDLAVLDAGNGYTNNPGASNLIDSASSEIEAQTLNPIVIANAASTDDLSSNLFFIDDSPSGQEWIADNINTACHTGTVPRGKRSPPKEICFPETSDSDQETLSKPIPETHQKPSGDRGAENIQTAPDDGSSHEGKQEISPASGRVVRPGEFFNPAAIDFKAPGDIPICPAQWKAICDSGIARHRKLTLTGTTLLWCKLCRFGHVDVIEQAR